MYVSVIAISVIVYIIVNASQPVSTIETDSIGHERKKSRDNDKNVRNTIEVVSHLV